MVIYARLYYWLDVDFFVRTLRSFTDEARNVDNVADDDELLEAALSLYTDEFLAGFHVPGVPAFEEWVLVQREHLRCLAIHGLGVLADRRLQRGDIQTGLRATRRLLALEPWYESAIWHAPSGELLNTLAARGPYAGMKIKGAAGLSMAQREALIALGASGK